MVKTSRAIIIKDNKLLVFFRRRIRNGKEVTYYAIPGGHVEENESLSDCVIRELKEEMNIDIRVISYLGNIIVENKEENYFHCEIVGGVLKFGGEELERCNDDNYYEIRWLDLNKIDDSDIRAISLIKKVINNG